MYLFDRGGAEKKITSLITFLKRKTVALNSVFFHCLRPQKGMGSKSLQNKSKLGKGLYIAHPLDPHHGQVDMICRSHSQFLPHQIG
jgi:hypothetical protein